MWPPLHDAAGQQYRILRVPRRRDGPGDARAVHDRGVELDRTVGRQRRAPAGVEEGVVLELDDGRANGVKGAASGREDATPGRVGLGQAGLERLPFLLRQLENPPARATVE